MPPLLSTTAILFILFSFLHPAYSENVSEPALNVSSTCPVPLSPLLSFNPASLNPTCSLSSRPADPAPEFLSFEEWKAKQLAVQESPSSKDKDSHTPTTKSNTETKLDSKIPENETVSYGRKNADVAREVRASVEANDTEHANPSPSALKYHIPLIDRFNYASNECNARIHSSHKSAKSSSSILSRKKDRYMLSPCQLNKEKHFVVVELCEDIRIDTVQLANFEFFSGVFKDIRVSAAQTYTSDGKGWTVVGEYTAKNIRGIQSFHPQRELLPFYRYLRVDFLSYYGKEYFCPVSLLRVYGLTQMEEWKSDLWKAEWEASHAASIDVTTKEPEDSVIILGTGPLSTTASPERHIPSTAETIPSSTTIQHYQMDELQGTSQNAVVTPSETNPGSSQAVTDSPTDVPSTSHPIPETGATRHVHTTESKDTPETQETSIPQTQSPEGHSVVVDGASNSSEETVISTAPPTSSTAVANPDSGYGDRSTSVVTRTVSTTIILSAATPSSSPSVPNGESVYRMIINRIGSLEANQTLYARYVEEQGRSVNIRLELIEEDIGRLGAVVTAQQQRIKKMFERHRADMEHAHGQLAAQVENLAHEVLMEKRLGILQLVLLLTVLVFMALTRGSRGEPIRLRRAGLVWNKGLRHSADWMTGWKGSASRLHNPDDENADLQPNDAADTSFNLDESPIRRPHGSSRRSRRSSSHSARHDNIVRTPSPKPRNFVRSRQNSNHSRNRTPLGAFRRSSNNTTRVTADLVTEALSAPKRVPLAVANENIQDGQAKAPHHKETWRASGRSISLTGGDPIGHGLGAGGSMGNLPDSRNHGSTRRLARTAHLHEVKTPAQRSRGNTIDDTRLFPGVSLLSPMTEASTPGFTPNPQMLTREDKTGPTRITGFDSSELRGESGPTAARSDGVLSDLFSIPTTSSLASPQAIPFPSPGPVELEEDEEGTDEDMWVDDEQLAGGDDADERHMSRHSPRTKRSRFNFGSPRKPFVLSSSPPNMGVGGASGIVGGGGRGRFRFSKRSDVSMASIPRG